MKELTDLEIEIEIAKIEGVKFTVKGNRIAADTFQVHELFSCAHMGFIFNPLTDKALCFDLLIRYDIDLISPYRVNGETKWEAQIFTNNGTVNNIYDENPQRAICLAIIEAHKGK